MLNCQDVCPSILVQDTMFPRRFQPPGTNEIFNNKFLMSLNSEIGPARDWSSGCLPPERAPRLRRSRLLDNYLAFHVQSQHKDPPRPLCRLLHPVWKHMFNIQQQLQQEQHQQEQQQQQILWSKVHLSNIYSNWLKKAATSKPLTLSNCSRQEVSSCCRTKPVKASRHCCHEEEEQQEEQQL